MGGTLKLVYPWSFGIVLPPGTSLSLCRSRKCLLAENILKVCFVFPEESRSVCQTMLETRSAVLKMMQSEAFKDRRINFFPRPFSGQYTPYQQNDFSFAVREVCSSSKQPLTGLKISKAIFLGDVAVGKTSLVNRYCHELFDGNYKATIGVDFEVERFDVLKVPFNLQIWDTAGQERFKCIASSYYRGAQVVAVVFDLSNLYTLSHCAQWLEEALACNTLRPLVFLVGTKRDLLSSSAYKHVEKQATSLAYQLGAEYWAVSSRTGDGVCELFLRMAALAFEVSVLRDLNTVKNKVEIGTELVSLKKVITAPKKQQLMCYGSTCH